MYNHKSLGGVVMEATQVMETNDVESFSLLLEEMEMPYDECGIHFNGEIVVGDGVSLIIDEMVKQDNPERARENYLKVLEVQELTEIEKSKAAKARFLFKKLFDSFFKGKKSNVILGATYAALMIFDLVTENYLGALIVVAFYIFVFDFKKGFRAFIEFLKTGKRLETLKEELKGSGLTGNAELVDKKEDIYLYVKSKIM